MINFTENNLIFNLHPVTPDRINKHVKKFLVSDEQVIDVFTTVRDQVIFTTKRIIAVDVQGIGAKKEFVTIPYSKIQYFTVQTPGVAELIHDNELQLFFSDGFKARFEFMGSYDITRIARIIGERIF